jgi:hypothetical protein
MKISKLIVIWVLMLAQHAQPAIFYCDPLKGSKTGDGSEGKPWRTIQEVIELKLIRTFNSNGEVINKDAPIKAGDTILLRSGWHGVIQIASGYNDIPIEIAAENECFPEVGWIEIGEGKNWIIKGLTISPSLSPRPLTNVPANLVTLCERGGTEQSTNLVVQDCFIFTERDSTKWSANEWITKAKNGIWLGRHGSRHIARNNYVLNTRFGIQLCAPYVICEGNIVENFSADGIRVTRDGQIVQYNVVKNVFVSSKDGDANHDDGIQAFLFNVGTGTLRDVSIIGNIIIERENDDLPFPNQMQGIGFFDGPLVNFQVVSNVVCVNHWHGITLGDAQRCKIYGNICYSRWQGEAKPWIMVGQKKGQAFYNLVSNNLAYSFDFTADKYVTSTNNNKVTLQDFLKKRSEILKLINVKFGSLHPVALRARLGDQTQ